MNDFEVVMKFGQELEAKWLDNAIKDDKNKKSFRGVQRELQVMNLFLRNEWKDADREYQRILENRKYTPDFIGKQREIITAQYQEKLDQVVTGTKATIKQMIADKFKRLDKMLTEAPTTEQMALLQALQMRTGSLSKGELMKILPFFFRNYQSMRILEAIAETAGKKISIPLDGDVMDLYGLLDRGGQYLLGAADQLAAHGNPSPKYKAFFYSDPENPGNADLYYQQFIDCFDVPAQLQDYTITDKLTPAEQVKVKSYFSRISDLDPTKGTDNLTILRETQQVMREHPEDLGLMKRSDYAKYVREVEELEAINRKEAEKAANTDEKKKEKTAQ